HAHGWLHLDLKPQNIMIDRKQHVTVIDIGIAQRKNQDGTAVASGDGTHAFMAPEQRAGALVDDRADVFALAGTLYRLVSQHNPIAATNEPSVVGTRLDEVQDLALRAILKKGMAPVAADRYSSAAQLAEALRGWEQQQR
ncbi:MAG: protein kinase, partial [Polyangia bacterium]